MKNSVKISLLAVLLCFAFSAQAQVKIGVKGGFNAASQSGWGDLLEYEDEDLDYSSKFKSGFHLGLMLQLDLPGSFFLQPELLFSNQGLKQELKFDGEKDSESSTLNYLQLPIYAGYKFDAGLGLKVIVGVGPYFAYGISGSDDVFDGDKGFMKRFDAGLTAMAGVEISKFQVTLGYDFGLVDAMDANGWKTLKDLGGLSSIRNQNIKVSVGYFF